MMYSRVKRGSGNEGSRRKEGKRLSMRGKVIIAISSKMPVSDRYEDRGEGEHTYGKDQGLKNTKNRLRQKMPCPLTTEQGRHAQELKSPTGGKNVCTETLQMMDTGGVCEKAN